MKVHFCGIYFVEFICCHFLRCPGERQAARASIGPRNLFTGRKLQARVDSEGDQLFIGWLRSQIGFRRLLIRKNSGRLVREDNRPLMSNERRAASDERSFRARVPVESPVPESSVPTADRSSSSKGRVVGSLVSLFFWSAVFAINLIRR